MYSKQPETSWRHRLLMLSAVAFIAFVFFYRIADKALDFDERYSMNIATGTGGHNTEYSKFGRFIATPVPGASFTPADYAARFRAENVVSTAMNDNGQGLPYFFLLHVWLKTFGITTATARTLSALLMLLSVGALYFLLRRCRISPGWILVTLLLFASNGVIIGLAQYVRFYSLGILLTILSCLLTIRLRERTSALAGTLLGLLWSVLVLNQFFAAFVVAGEILYLALTLKRASFKIMLPLTAGMGFIFLVWLLPLHGWESLRNIYALHTRERLAIPELTTTATPLHTTLALLASFAGAAGQPVNILAGTRSVLLQIAPALPALLLIWICIRRRDMRQAWTSLCLLVVGIYALVSIVHATATGYTLLFQNRYWVFAYVFMYLLLAAAFVFGYSKGGLTKCLAVTALLLSLGRAFYTDASAVSGLSLNGRGQLIPNHVQAAEDYEGMANDIRKTLAAGDTVSYNSWITAQATNWFLLKDPAIVQKVDTAQKVFALIVHYQKREEVPVGRGRTQSARPLWR